MRVLLINDTDAHENIGCRLTSSTLKCVLAETLGHGVENYELIPAPWRFTKRIMTDDPAFRAAVRARAGLFGREALGALARTEYGDAAVDALAAVDLVVFQPEGTISDPHGTERILRNLSLPLFALLHTRLPVVVVNGTFPLFEDQRRQVIAGLLGNANFSALRDRMSAEFWGTSYCPDSAIAFSGTDCDPSAAGYVLLTTAAECPEATDHAIARAGLDFCKANALKPLALTKAWQRFAPYRDEITAMGGRFLESATLGEADALLAQCRLHFGGRYHMAIFCATKGIPSCLIRSNTHKNLWLAEDFNGIEMATTPVAMPKVAGALLGAVPHEGLLADVATCRDMLTGAIGQVRDVLDAPPRVPPAEAEAETWLTDKAWDEIVRSYRVGRFKRFYKRILRR